MQSEQQLKAWMVGSLRGDAAAHAALLHALVPLLRSFYGRRLHHRAADAEDLVQETLIAVHTRRATYDCARPFTAWLYAIARYRLVDFWRRHRSSVSLDEALLIEDSFEDAALAQMDVEALLSTLSPRQARAIRDTHVEGKSVAEAAAESGVGESALKVSVHRGLKTLAARIKGARP
jgi:RNA polymerase sigma-70 factor (ECF subfamily)